MTSAAFNKASAISFWVRFLGKEHLCCFVVIQAIPSKKEGCFINKVLKLVDSLVHQLCDLQKLLIAQEQMARKSETISELGRSLK